MEIELKLKMENAQNIVLYFIRNSNNSNQAMILKSKNTHTHKEMYVCVCDHRSVYFALVMKFAQIFYNYGVCLLLRVDALIDMEKLESVKLQKKQKGRKNTTPWRTDYGEYELDRHGNIYTLRHTHIHAAEGSGID